MLQVGLDGRAVGITGAAWKFDLAWSAATDVTINPVLLADWLEAIRNAADRLGGAEKQHTTLAEREMEEGQDLPLRLRVQVDEQIAQERRSSWENGASASRL